MTSHLVHLSDLHFGNEDPAALEAAATYISAEKPAAVIVSGDLTAVGSPSQMQAAFAWLRSLGSPVLAAPGNHDTPYFEIIPRLIDPFGGFFRASEGIRTQPWIGEDLAIIPINTARGVQFRKNWALGAISRSQVVDAAAAIRNAPAGALKIVVTHHPLSWPDDAPIAGDTRGGEAALEALMAAGANLFMSGHLHLSNIRMMTRAGRTSVLASAGTLSVRHRGEPGGFFSVRREGTRLEVERLYSAGGQAVSGGVQALAALC